MDKNLFGVTPEHQAVEICKMYEPPEGYYLAFSGGKDSICLMAIALRSGVKFDAHYNSTGIDPPEVVRFIREEYPEVSIDHPPKSFWEWSKEKGLPTRTRRWCCEKIKEVGGEGRRLLVGIRAAESGPRKRRGIVHQCKRADKTAVNPLFQWTDDDVWAFIRETYLKYPSLYDEGWKRIGCVVCPFESRQRTQINLARWPKIFAALKKRTRVNWDRRVETGADWPKRFNMDFETYWRWWIARKAPYPEAGGGGLFGPD